MCGSALWFGMDSPRTLTQFHESGVKKTPVSRITSSKNLPISAAHPVIRYSGVAPPRRSITGVCYSTSVLPLATNRYSLDG